ncbi:hypothetical protein BDP27DRAFT_1328031 [Rhodocollybia butyracea]|uniref:Uncharacterized protein n=1 Tax=Rhodocollybia butyracea TaxID=206335 RepID=A0A9P5PR85_9AGAR|nr:hypothetical protein BDP27DRAFT_1328031 [Rhodocollybia butyracea]
MFHPRPSPFLLLFCIGLVLLNFRIRPVTARLYPTRPVKDTVYQCGKCDSIQWKDDGKSPNMLDMGPVTVDLYCGNKYVFTVGQSDPATRILEFCPPRDFPWPKIHDKYMLLFNSTNEIRYSHDFNISGTSRATHINIKNSSISDENPSSLRTIAGPGGRTFVLSPTPTMTSASVHTTGSLTAPVATKGHDTISTTAHAHPLTSVHRNSAFLSRGMNVEKMKFRFVFIVWPALIGISMAL